MKIRAGRKHAMVCFSGLVVDPMCPEYESYTR